MIGNFSDSGQSAEDMIFQAYEAVKKVLVNLHKEVSSIVLSGLYSPIRNLLGI
ncbi:hypothetical protein D3C74_466920 [compost metagenome]